MSNTVMRQFASGATRHTDDSKPDPEGFLSPLFLDGFFAYMQAHRMQADGKLRESDNWQKGIPIEVYKKSLVRHFFTAWALWRGHPVKAEQVGTESRTPTLLDALYAMIFNIQGIIHEMKKAETPRFSNVGASQSVAYNVPAADRLDYIKRMATQYDTVDDLAHEDIEGDKNYWGV